MEIDTHNMNFKEAKEYILSCIERCYNKKDGRLTIIHGYNHGTRIKEWINNAKFNEMVSNVMPSLTNSGISYVYIKTKIK